MPQIPVYTSQISAPGPIETKQATAQEMGGGIGQAIEGLGNAMQDAGDRLYKRQENTEVSDIHQKLADLHLKKTQELRERLMQAKPGDPDFTEEFKNSLQTDMDNLSSAATTVGAKAYLQRAGAELNQHFLESSAAGQVELAGKFEVQNFVDARDKHASALLQDPGGLKLALENSELMLQRGVDNKRWSQAQVGELREQTKKIYAEAAIKGSMRQGKFGPNKTIADLEAGVYDGLIDGKMKDRLLDESLTMKRAVRQDEELERIRLERIKKQDQNKVGRDALKEIDAGTLTLKKLLEDPKYAVLDSFGEGSIATIKGQLERWQEQGGQFKSDPQVKGQVYQQIFNTDPKQPTINTEAQIRAKVGYGLNPQDAETMIGYLNEREKPVSALREQLVKTARAELVKGGMFSQPDGFGERQHGKFLAYIEEEEKKLRDQGKAPDATFYDNLSQSIQLFKKTESQKIKEQVAEMKVVKLRTKAGGLQDTDIDQMSLEDLEALGTRGLSPAQMDKARIRYNMLYNQRLKTPQGK